MKRPLSPESAGVGLERLQRFLARAGLGSRRSCEALILAGKVRVNGQVVSKLGTKVALGIDEVTCKGKRIEPSDRPLYLILHKPAGVLTSLSDPHGRPVVTDLLPRGGLPRLFPVGRLDFQTEGLLLLTNDGALAHALMHPSSEVEKEYFAKVSGCPTPAALDRLEAGVVSKGERLRADKAVLVRPGTGSAWVKLVIHEGRYHEIRRMCDAIGHPVLKLKRVRLGPIALGKLPKGAWRRLLLGELASLRRSVALPASSATTAGQHVGPRGRAGAQRKRVQRRPSPATPFLRVRGVRSRHVEGNVPG